MNIPSELKHRTAERRIALHMRDGSSAAGKKCIIRQTGHRFLFGANGFKFIPFANGELTGVALDNAEAYNISFREIFNFATLPFYWGRYEPERGQTIAPQIRKTAQWCIDNGILLKGHPLCWHTLAPQWLLSMSNSEIFQTQMERIHREVTGFRGLIDMWDAINEAVIMPVFNKYDNGLTRICAETGRIKLIKKVFEAARAANSDATFIINDFDVSQAYEILIEGCLEAGVKIDAIGIQSHMHQGYWGVEKTLAILERYERFKLPIHFSETTILSGSLMPPEYEDLNDYQVKDWPSTPDGEERQAEDVALHYKTLFSRPLVQGITWWDFSDGEWLNAPCGLLRRDYSEKPAYTGLRKLIRGEWWTPESEQTADGNGILSVTGFTGSYEITCGKERAIFDLDHGTTDISVTIE